MRTSKGNKMIKTNIKMRVTSEESKQVQEICFANGLGWVGGDFTPALFDKEYLMICDVITWDDKKRFCELNLEEVSANLFIKTKGTCIEETPEQALKQNTNNKNKEETMEKNEVKSYADVKEYLIAKGLYERVLEIDWDLEVVHTEFNELFIWADAKEGYNFWNDLDDDLIKLRIEKKIESLVQDYKSKQGKEFIKHLEAQPEEVVETKPKPTSYIDVKEYLIAKGLYERVLEIDWALFYDEEGIFSDLFTWSKTEEGYIFWDELYGELVDLDIYDKIESLMQDYKAKQGKESNEYIETQPEEVVETKPLEKPKQYLCYVQGKALPKHIHKSLEQAKQEAHRLCIKELAKVSVLEVVAEYEAEVLVKEL